jgi:hypothetical protein
VSQPRISVFASLANGNAVPSRVIQGARTLQARSSHYIAVDSVRDELVVPNPFAQAILFFRGGATGNEAPLRIIQGPKTLLNAPDNVAVDAAHREIFIAQFPTDSIMVFRSDVAGDVAPIRVIRGPQTKLDRPIRVDVDPVNNLIGVTTSSAILIFNRTADGDVAPRWVISGQNAGVGARYGTRDVKLFPQGKKIIAVASRGGEPRRGESGGDEIGAQRLVAVWNYGDNGNVVPWAVLNTTPTTRLAGNHLGLNPDAAELLVGGSGVIRVYRLPEVFSAGQLTRSATQRR